MDDRTCHAETLHPSDCCVRPMAVNQQLTLAKLSATSRQNVILFRKLSNYNVHRKPTLWKLNKKIKHANKLLLTKITTFCQSHFYTKIKGSQYVIIKLADARRILTAVPQSDWRRPVGRPHSSWMATLKNDLSLHNLTSEDTIEMALDKPLWGLLAASGATHWWCMPNNDDDDDDDLADLAITRNIHIHIHTYWLHRETFRETGRQTDRQTEPHVPRCLAEIQTVQWR